ncbi:adenosylhomocysteine nucleosidase [Lachnospiraceae bacterium C7]|nr:adenosylhomocysteine nucleosidase [Lachnospiraceae bacterium C7]
MKIGVIGAMQIEVDNLKKAMTVEKTEEVSSVSFTVGKLGDVDVVAAVCGVGKVFAAICAETMILKYDVDMVINIGVAGSLTDKLKVFDVAVAKQVVQHDMDTSPLGDPIGLLSGINKIYLPTDENIRNILVECLKEKKLNYLEGTIATGDQFVHDDAKKQWICENFDAIAAEMEGGSIGHVCYVNKVPFVILRTISDSEGGVMDYQTFAEKAAQVGIDIVTSFINKVGADC